MTDTKEMLQNQRFSYSSVSLFDTCPYAFKLTYIDKVERSPNFYSDFGLLVHHVLSLHWSEEKDIWELSQTYKQEYNNFVQSPLPPYQSYLGDRYYDYGLDFFNSFDLNRDEYNVLINEDTIETEIGDIKLVVKPDLVIQHKETGDIILLDYKTSSVIDKKGKVDEKKLDGYKKQLILYGYFLAKVKSIKVNKIRLLMIRDSSFIEIDFDKKAIDDVLGWFKDTIENIREETEWEPNNSNTYFCNVLCGARNRCSYRKG